MSTDRPRRVGALIHRELAQVISREMDDPRVKLVAITAVDVSPDLKNATVFVSSVGDQGAAQAVVEVLNGASHFLRHHLGHNIELRVTPALRFRYDESIQRGAELERLIDDLVKQPEDNRTD